MLLAMISGNSLAAFTQEVARSQPAQPVRGIAPTGKSPGQDAASSTPASRTLESVPPMPAQPLPRGSLLDLRV